LLIKILDNCELQQTLTTVENILLKEE
jgi:hypothetical protein